MSDKSYLVCPGDHRKVWPGVIFNPILLTYCGDYLEHKTAGAGCVAAYFFLTVKAEEFSAATIRYRQSFSKFCLCSALGCKNKTGWFRRLCRVNRIVIEGVRLPRKKLQQISMSCSGTHQYWFGWSKVTFARTHVLASQLFNTRHHVWYERNKISLLIPCPRRQKPKWWYPF